MHMPMFLMSLFLLKPLLLMLMHRPVNTKTIAKFQKKTINNSGKSRTISNLRNYLLNQDIQSDLNLSNYAALSG